MDIVNGVIRAVVPPVIAYLIGKGLLPSADYGAVITAFMALVTAAWSVKSNIKK